MKELSIEEKAARYDRSLERARDVHTYYCDDREQLRKIEHIFPELKESEGEKIRKTLVDYFKTYKEQEECGIKTFYGIPTDNIIAWLEKQGEQNPISLEDAAKLFLEKLSESPYNNKPITDAQVITKELINFLKDTNTYNPNAINEQKPAWSEEDEELLNTIINHFKVNVECTDDDDIIKWLKSLKDRVQPQPKQEWKQENTEELSDFENVMMHIGNSFFGQHAGLDPNDTDAIKKQANLLLELVPKQEWSEEDIEILETCISLMSYNDAAKEETDWLKSLRERYTWKPSDEQMDALCYVTNFDYGGYKATLVSLYEQLKKLKG